VQGGSTVTQQLAKNLFLKPDRTMERKVQEMVLAIWLETRFTKDEILQLYLNRVYYGSGATGIEKAAQTYYNKSARELDINEAATLAGLLKAPSNYNPIAHPKVAAARAALVIDSMVESDFITQSEADAAINSPAAVAASDYIPATQYVVDWVNEQLPDLASKYDQSIIVETTIDPDLQALAEKSLRKRLNEEGKKLNIGQGALVLMDAGGAVKAMVGGRSYKRSQFNRATKAKRQPGSAFKPFVYLAAIENGYTPSSVEVDEPIRIGDWEPDNYKHKYAGPVTLKRALAQSLNTIAAKLTNEVGPQAVVRVAHKLGIGSPLGTDASIALGTSEVTLLEMTGAFAPFANGGQTVAPYAITRISTRDGKVLYERSGDGLGRAISIYDVGFMNEMMRAVVQEGTAKRAAFDGQDLGGKTGTSQDSRDAWFVGYSSYLVAGVWVGNDDNSPMRNVTGGTLPAKIWKDVMEVAHAGLPFQALPGITDDEPATDEPVNVSEYGDESLYEEEPDQRPRRGKGFFESLFNSEDEPSRKKPRQGDKTAFQEMQERLKNK
jgi:penicillin-binding protein 1A